MIFGTDGIRGAFGVPPMDAKTITRLAQIAANWVPQNGSVVLGQDTRESGGEITRWLLNGFAGRGITVYDLGTVPTPVVAVETKALSADLGIMITASHNPYTDNGLKFFTPEGLKLSEEAAQSWSRSLTMMETQPENKKPPATVKSLEPEQYRALIVDAFDSPALKGFEAAFDYAHGAAVEIVPSLLETLGIEAHHLGNHPNGRNINGDRGALHPEHLSTYVAQHGLKIGFAFDGDGDRLVAVDEHGPIHGDIVLYALKERLWEHHGSASSIVGTILTGAGLEQVLGNEGISLTRTPVGDKHVMNALLEQGLPLGGEPSGHFIQTNVFPAGDGFVAALQLIHALAEDPRALSRAREIVPIFPSLEKSYRVRHKPPLDSLPRISSAVETLRSKVAGNGQFILRYSGTEPKIRLFLEARDLTHYAKEVAELERLFGELL